MHRYKPGQQPNTEKWTVHQKESGVRLLYHERNLNEFPFQSQAYDYAFRELSEDRHRVFYLCPGSQKQINFFF